MISIVLVLMVVQSLGARKAYLEEEAGRDGMKSVPYTINYQGYLPAFRIILRGKFGMKNAALTFCASLSTSYRILVLF